MGNSESSHSTSELEAGCDNISYSITAWKELEDNVFQATEDSLSRALALFRNNSNYIHVSSLINIILFAAKTRPFAFKILGDFFQSIYSESIYPFTINPFTLYLFSRNILSKKNLPKYLENDKCSSDYESVFPIDSFPYAVIHDDLVKVSEFSAQMEIKSFISIIWKKSLSSLDLSAFSGSKNVFEYFLANGFLLEDTTLEWSIKGGNEIIIQIIEQSGFSFRDYGYFALKYHHHQIFHWLINKYPSNELNVNKYIKWNNTTAIEYYLINEKGKTFLNSSLLQSSSSGNLAVTIYLVNKGAFIEDKDQLGQTSLFLASKFGNYSIVKYLIEKGANIETRDIQYRYTPLMIACKLGFFEIVKLLLEKGANIKVTDLYEYTPLHHAAENNHVEIVEYLINKGIDIGTKTKRGRTLLQIAIVEGSIDVVKYLYEIGATLKNDEKFVFIAAIRNGHHEVVEYLVENLGSYIMDDQYYSPLISSIESSNLVIMNYLIDHGADIEAKDHNGITPLIAAARNEDSIYVRILIEKGAHIDAGSNINDTPLIVASRYERIETIMLLIEMGVSIEERGVGKTTPLIAVSYEGKLDVVKYLISVGANFEASDRIGRTPLIVASYRGYLDVVKYLISVGADFEAADYKGRTPLIVASYEGRLDVVKYLISAGADFESADYKGRTPFLCAAYHGKRIVVEYLYEIGANIDKKDSKGWTPLIKKRSNNNDKVDLIIGQGAAKRMENYNNGCNII